MVYPYIDMGIDIKRNSVDSRWTGFDVECGGILESKNRMPLTYCKRHPETQEKRIYFSGNKS
jgi:hypothetical protein